MTDDQFDAFLDRCMAELHGKQERMGEAFSLGTFASFWFDQPSGTLEFRDSATTPRVIARVVPIGSHSHRSGTWMWAWANQSIVPELRALAEPIKHLAAVTKVSAFSQATIKVPTAEMPWELTAFAVHQLKAMGAYKAPGGNSDLYLAILTASKSQPA